MESLGAPWRLANGADQPSDGVGRPNPTTMTESPVPGATNVALSDRISASFSEPLENPSTVPDGAVSLACPQHVS